MDSSRANGCKRAFKAAKCSATLNASIGIPSSQITLQPSARKPNAQFKYTHRCPPAHGEESALKPKQTVVPISDAGSDRELRAFCLQIRSNLPRCVDDGSLQAFLLRN